MEALFCVIDSGFEFNTLLLNRDKFFVDEGINQWFESLNYLLSKGSNKFRDLRST